MSKKDKRDDMVFSKEKLTEFAIQVLETAGVSSKNAKRTADILVFADLRGIFSHGISKLPIYIRRIQLGGIDSKAEPEIISENEVLSMIDGRNALGPVSGGMAADKAVDSARKSGFGISLVRNSNHFGATAYYAMIGLKEGMIGFAISNSNPMMAPWGGSKPIIGTNPLAVAVPTNQGLPIVLDMASSTVARGKIIMAASQNKQLPRGWALDSAGKETTDPQEALNGMLVPLGGPKGSGLAIIIDILSGVLSQSCYLTNVGPLYSDLGKPQGVGHCIAAININSIMPKHVFLSMMDQYVKSIKESPPKEAGAEIYLPGELEYIRSIRHRQAGIPLSEDTRNELNSIAKEFGVDCL